MHVKTGSVLIRLIRMIVLTMSYTALSSLHSHAQIPNIYAHASLAEKIYLQLDSKVYTTDNTIWFKAIVTQATDHAPTILSSVLYVELIDPGERVVEKKLIKIEYGIGEGFFQLNQQHAEGLYLIRAYTEWNKNFGSDFFLKEYINVFAATAKPKAEPIKNVTLVEGQNTARRLNATFDPFAIDSLHSKELTLVISFDDKKDSISLKKNGSNKYLLDYPIPAKCQFVTLQVQTKNHFSYSKTIVLDKDYLDLQFFPESGELVHGIPAIVGFKALDCNGKGKMVEGEIVDGQGTVTASFKSNQFGMGSVELTKVDSSVKFFARLLTQPKSELQKTYPLPVVAPKGNVLSVKKMGNGIQLKAASNYLLNDSITIRATCRGMIYYDIKGLLKQGNLVFSLPADKLPEGVIAFTMITDSMRPVAERLYFNEGPESRINISIATDKDLYNLRELTKLTITTTDAEGTPLNASLSVLVLNKEQMGNLQDRRQNILSYFLLSSDLKGDIEDPGIYFTKDENRYQYLDALLLTQGWRKYNYTKPVGKIQFQPESHLTVSGVVGGLFFKKKLQKETGLTMMSFGKNTSIQTQATDSMGRFNFLLNDEYGDKVNILIQSSNKSGAKKDYTITLDKKETPVIAFDHVKSVEQPDSVIHAFVEKNTERKKLADAMLLSSGKLLGEVVLKSYKMTPERKKVADAYGEPDYIIEGQAIRDKEAKWSYGLYSVLLFNFPDRVRIVTKSDGNLYAQLHNSEITLVVIDGVPVRPEQYPLIPNIPPSEVISFELIAYAKNFSTLYCEIFPQNCVNAPAWGNVIAIYTYGKKGIFGANRSVGIMKTAIPVFSSPREFYAPKHEQLKPADWLNPDLRALIHWQPSLIADSSGKASTAFYNADNTGTVQVVVEAIAENGQIGYQQVSYDVKKQH